MDIVVRPLTSELWPAFEDLVGHTGPLSRCWCMYWRTGAQYRRLPSDQNREAFRDIVRDGPPMVEAYPLDAALSPSATGTGYASAFEQAGFTTMAQLGPPRPIMRYELTEQ